MSGISTPNASTTSMKPMILARVGAVLM